MRDVELKIPRNEKLFVTPEVRVKLFDHMLAEYKKRYPETKMIYAMLLWGNIQSETETITAYQHKLTGRYLSGDYVTDCVKWGLYKPGDSVENNPLIQKKEITFPTAHQDIQIDYCIIWKSPYENRIYFDLPYIHTNRSIPGYRYCLREKKLDLWFQIAFEEMPNIEEDKWKEYITFHCNLSFDKNDEKYWKNPKNKVILLSSLVDLQLRHKPKV